MLIICCSFFRVLIKEVGKIGAKVGRMYKKIVHVYVLMFLGFIADGSSRCFRAMKCLVVVDTLPAVKG